MMICTFENKDVHAIDYASGDIMHQFIFKDDMIQEEDMEKKKPTKMTTMVASAPKISLNLK